MEDLNNNLNMFSNNIKSYILFAIVYIMKIFTSNFDNFMKFMVSKNVVGLGIGILLGTQIGNFINSVNRIILTPIIKYIENKNNNLYSISYNIFGIDIKYGELLLSVINLIISLLIIYIMWYFTNMEGSVVTNYLNNLIMYIGMDETN